MTSNHRAGAGAALALLLTLTCGLGAAVPEGDAPGSVRTIYPEPPSGAARYLTRFGLEFQGTSPNFRYLPAPAPSMRCEAGSPFSYADAWFTPPDGARLSFVDVFGRDESAASDLHFFLFRVCQRSLFDPPGESVNVLLGEIGSDGVTGPFLRVIDLTAEPEVLAGYQCKYLVRARFAAIGSACPANVMAIDKVRFWYDRLP